MSRIIERALSIINDNLKDQTTSFADPISIKPMARGGRLLEDDYPTHYLPHVGRQVMADGGDADPIGGALDVAQSIPETPMPSLRPNPPAPKVPSAEGRVMPPSPIPPAKGFTYRTPDEAALAVIENNKGSGLQFPDDESFARLHKKIRREDSAAAGKKAAGQPLNDRMVIKAPEDSGLPDFVTGKINYGDWIARHENILNDDEIHHAADWYNRIYDEFKQYYPDEEESKKNMRAWLVAQQNVSPAGAMQNVLLQKEQMKRGVPKALWRAGGMPNPTEAARDVLQDQPIGGGVGQKIADFVDSAEGKSVRSWMANHPDGGEPFVVDVHTARDTGMVDQELLNHLDRLGYDKEALKKVQIDLTGTPSEPAYENRAAWGRGLTDHLNEIGWKGRNDWTPAEVQAVGWMGMTKLTRNAEEDVQSGLAKNLRRIAYEAEPINGSPWHKKYSKQLNALSPEDKLEVTSRLTESALKHASDLSGIDVHSLIHGSGAGKNQSAVAQSLATKGGADIAANALGYLLNQGEVWHNRVKPMTSAPKGYAIDFVQSSGKDLEDSEKIKDFWNKITKADDSGLFQGFHPIKLPSGEVGIRALVDKGGDKIREKIESALAENSPIQKAIADFGLDIDMLGHEAEISKARNNWMENKNGEGYMERLVELIGADRAASLNSVRQKLEGELDAHLQEVGQRQAEPPKRSRKKIEKSYGGAIIPGPKLTEENADDFARRLIAWSFATAPLFQRADGGAVEDPVSTAVDTARQINPMGFYSAAAEAASKFPQRAPIDQIINKIKGQPNVKKEELDNANLADAFAGQRSVDPKEVARHLQASVPQIEETVYGNYKYKPEKMRIPSFNRFEDAEEVHRVRGPSDRADMFIGEHGTSGEPEYGVYDSSGRLHSMHENFEEAIAAANEHLGAETQPAVYSQYTIPGGENYREVVMHLPLDVSKKTKEARELNNRIQSGEFNNLSDQERVAKYAERDKLLREGKAQEKEPFRSTHWGEPNVVAHLRLSDRDDGKTLHMEELQSDWGQAGRDEGFYDPNREKTDSILTQMSRDVSSAVPKAPYVTSTDQWVDLGLKRALMEAAKGGYDKLIWTPGEEQADRYKLSKHVKALAYDPEEKTLSYLPHTDPNYRGYINIPGDVEPHEVKKHIGKEMAKRLLATEPHKLSGNHILEGLDLEVGKEGMQDFYDKLVPQRLNKLVAQYDKDVKVAPHSHSLKGENGEVKAHSIQITPRLREAILKGGLPAFEKGGSVIDAALDVVSKLRR